MSFREGSINDPEKISSGGGKISSSERSKEFVLSGFRSDEEDVLEREGRDRRLVAGLIIAMVETE